MAGGARGVPGPITRVARALAARLPGVREATAASGNDGPAHALRYAGICTTTGPGLVLAMFRRLPAGHLDLARRQTQPAVVYITRLTGAAILAYLAALLLTGSDRPVLAPLTALLVVQASLFQTIRSAIRRVSAVTIGVLLAVILSAYIPFSWWMLGLLIAGSLALGMILRLGEEILEVPISEARVRGELAGRRHEPRAGHAGRRRRRTGRGPDLRADAAAACQGRGWRSHRADVGAAGADGSRAG